MGKKLSQITAAGRNINATDTYVAVSGVNIDERFTALEMVGGFADLSLGPANPVTFGAVGDGTTDNATALQNCFDSGADYVVIPGGQFATSTGIFIPDNVRRVDIVGELKYIGANVQNACLFIDGTPQLLMQGGSFNVANTYTLAMPIIIADDLGATANVTIRDVRFRHSGRMSIWGVGSGAISNLNIVDCTMEDFRESGIQLITCGTPTIKGCSVLGDGTQLIHTLFVSGDGGAQILDNYVYKGSANGFSVGITDVTNGLIIKRNRIIDGIIDDIEVSVFSSNLAGFMICDNYIDHPNVASTDLGIGQAVYGNRTCQAGLVANNFVSRTWACGIIPSLIVAGGNTITNVHVMNNNVSNCNQRNGGTVADSAIVISGLDGFAGNINKCTLGWNNIFSGDGKTKYAMAEYAGGGTVNHNAFVYNFERGSASGYSITGANTTNTGNLSGT